MKADRSSEDPSEIEALVLRSRSGDVTAFADLVKATENRVFRFTVYLCGNRELAQDIVQEAYVRAFEALGKLKEPPRFVNWLLTIARNLFIDRYRATPFVQELTEADIELMSIEKIDKGGPETLVAIQSTLSSLDPGDRNLLILAHIEGYSYVEIAETVGITVDVLKARLSRARRKFVKKYETAV